MATHFWHLKFIILCIQHYYIFSQLKSRILKNIAAYCTYIATCNQISKDTYIFSNYESPFILVIYVTWIFSFRGRYNFHNLKVINYLNTVTVIFNCMVHTFIVPWHYHSPPTGRFHRRGLAIAFLCVRQSVRPSDCPSVCLTWVLHTISLFVWGMIWNLLNSFKLSNNRSSLYTFVASGSHIFEKISWNWNSQK